MNQKLSILLVEDDISLSKGICYTLEKEGFNPISASNLSDAEKLISNNRINLAILDVSLPDGSGFDLCKKIRTTSDTPIIFLTACDEEVNIIMGLDMGADDYITKPFRVNELVSRINAVLRRSKTTTKKVSHGIFILDKDNYHLTKNGKRVELTITEYKLIKILISNKDQVFDRSQLIDLLWESDNHYVNENTLSVYIRRIREKIEDNPSSPRFIKTIRGVGYKWH